MIIYELVYKNNINKIFIPSKVKRISKINFQNANFKKIKSKSKVIKKNKKNFMIF